MTASERKDYWRRFLEKLRRQGLLRTPRVPYESTSQVIAEWSRHQVRLSARLNAEDHWIHIDLTLSGPERFEHFDRLSKESGRIPAELLATVSEKSEQWERDDSKHPKECWIYLRRLDDPMNRGARDAQHDWLMQTLVIFRQVFGTHIDRW